MKATLRVCPRCGEEKLFRADQETCGCKVVKPQLRESSVVEKDIWTLRLPKSRIHTLEQLVSYAKIDLNIWEVVKFEANDWEMGYVAEKHSVKTASGTNTKYRADYEQLFSVKATFKQRKDVLALQRAIEEILADMLKQMPAPPKVKKNDSEKGGMLEINLTDHHFAKLAWQLETLSVNYDVKIAVAVFNRALDTILSRAPFKRFEEIWFVVGNDLFHSDTTSGKTTSGTELGNTDVRYQKTWKTVRILMIRAIEKLRFFADKVKVIIVRGNHDSDSTWHFGDLLETRFEKYDDVEIDNSPAPRKYHVYGETLIGFTHGDKVRGMKLAVVMPTEARELFGKTKFHEWHTGHTHMTKVEEFAGIRVRILPALCATDKWHAENGYVGNLRSTEAYVWDKKLGLVTIIIYTDDDSLIEAASSTPTSVQE